MGAFTDGFQPFEDLDLVLIIIRGLRCAWAYVLFFVNIHGNSLKTLEFFYFFFLNLYFGLIKYSLALSFGKD